jgi:Uma2 family endonuclease
VLTAEEIAPNRALLLSRKTYHQLGDLGVYEGRRTQLLYGTVIDMSPMGTLHANAIRILTRHFVMAAGQSFDVMVQLPIAVSDESEPEPDFALVPCLPGHLHDQPPTTALLVIEVADSSLRLDLGPKATLYAEAGVPEYWVVDLKGRSTVVHRSPRRGKYMSVRKNSWSTLLISKAVPSITARFADLLKK